MGRHDGRSIFQRDEVVFAVVLLQEEHDVGEDDDDDLDGAVVPRLQLQHADALEHELSFGLQHVGLLELFAVVQDGGLGVDRFVNVQEALLALLFGYLRVHIFEDFLKKDRPDVQDHFHSFALSTTYPYEHVGILELLLLLRPVPCCLDEGIDQERILRESRCDEQNAFGDALLLQQRVVGA